MPTSPIEKTIQVNINTKLMLVNMIFRCIGIRTQAFWIKSSMLYQLSYTSKEKCYLKVENLRFLPRKRFARNKFSGEKRIWTSVKWAMIPMLYLAKLSHLKKLFS